MSHLPQQLSCVQFESVRSVDLRVYSLFLRSQIGLESEESCLSSVVYCLSVCFPLLFGLYTPFLVRQYAEPTWRRGQRVAASRVSFLFSLFTGGERERVSFFSFFVVGRSLGAREPASNFLLQLTVARVVSGCRGFLSASIGCERN